MISNQTVKRILVTVLFSALAAGAALASDLPPPARVPPRAPAVYAPRHRSTIGPAFTSASTAAGALARATGRLPISRCVSRRGNFNVNGGLVGGTVGFNWWVGGWVVGLEGDFDGSMA